MRYEWDIQKAAANKRKHGVSFEEAITVLESELTQWDPDRSELRLNALGFSDRGRLLFVVCVELIPEGLRIISARRATPTERRKYRP